MKKLVKKIFPNKLIIKTQNLLNKRNKKELEALLSSLPDQAKYLSIDDLERMNKNFPVPKQYGYDIETLHKRGQQRAIQIHNVIKHDSEMDNALEIGAKDGIVSHYLDKKYNMSCTCVDLNPKPISGISYGNTKFEVGDVTQLPFETDSFDLAFSFNSFEHFHQPKESLYEILRVLRPGGVLYLDFGPLYNAPKGLHAYNKILVPYCQLLFKYSTLEEYCEKHNFGELKFDINKGLNGWSIDQYRALWNEISSIAEIETYFENPTYKYLDFIKDYPEYFKGKFESIDNLIVTQIQIKIKKKPIVSNKTDA